MTAWEEAARTRRPITNQGQPRPTDAFTEILSAALVKPFPDAPALAE
jgi:hypothetical protein